MPHSDESSAKDETVVTTRDIYTFDVDDGSLDRVYHIKARLLNNAIQRIGMGKYQARTVSYAIAISNPDPTSYSGCSSSSRASAGLPITSGR